MVTPETEVIIEDRPTLVSHDLWPLFLTAVLGRRSGAGDARRPAGHAGQASQVQVRQQAPR